MLGIIIAQINIGVEKHYIIAKAKPVVRQGRKATGL